MPRLRLRPILRLATVGPGVLFPMTIWFLSHKRRLRHKRLDSNTLVSLRGLPLDVLGEVVREGEVTLSSQLTVALASDQRAITFAGIILTAATALLGAAGALVTGEEQRHLALAYVAIGLGVAYLVAGALALWMARPARHCLPGNDPANWLPHCWDVSGRQKRNMTQARVEQARNLQSMITKNRETAARASRGLLASIWLAYAATACAGLIFSISDWRNHPHANPRSLRVDRSDTVCPRIRLSHRGND